MMHRTGILVCVLGLLPASVFGAEPPAELDLSSWLEMPVFDDGRMMPVITFARSVVERICGRANPRLSLEGALPDDDSNSSTLAEAREVFPEGKRKFHSVELLFSWIAEPQRWERVPFLIAEYEDLRLDLLDLPVKSPQGGRLKYVSPRQLENAPKFQKRLQEISQERSKATAHGTKTATSTLDKKVLELYDAYATYRLLTFNPAAPGGDRSRFLSKLAGAIHAWKKLEPDLKRFLPRESGDEAPDRPEAVENVTAAGSAIDQLMKTSRDAEIALEEVEPLVVSFCRATAGIAVDFADHRDRVRNEPAPAGLDDAQWNQVRSRMHALASMTADLARQATEVHLALYDNGLSLRMVPALNPAALEKNRDPDDDTQPWLSLQSVIFGSGELLAGYPEDKVRQVRKAFREAAEAYVDRSDPKRPERFATAMASFAAAVRALGEAIEPMRRELSIKQPDEDLIAATAYPPPGATRAEVHYHQLDPFFWSWLIGLGAMVCFGLAFGILRKPMFWLGILVLVISQAFTIYGFGLRVYITGWAPVTNMFETVLFVALTVALLGLWFTMWPLTVSLFTLRLLRQGASKPLQQVVARKSLALVAASVAFLAALVAYYGPLSGRDIGPLMPVLRNNFWLTTHVLSITASYGAGLLAWGLANIALAYYLFGRYRDPVAPLAAVVAEGHRPAGGYRAPPEAFTRRPPEACAALGTFTYKSTQVAVLLLIVGTVLGAFWADVSWGRFWGWDPKEVWALISILIYLAVLHGRFAGLFGNFGLAVGSVVGATSILMAWYGVNYVLPAGLHSYGSGTGGLAPVLSIVAANWVFAALATVRYLIETLTPAQLGSGL